MFKQACTFVFLLLFWYSGFCQEKFAVVKDLRTDWTVFRDGHYQRPAEQSVSGMESVHFVMNAGAHPGSELLLKSSGRYYLFINGQLAIGHVNELRLKVDSLASRFGKTMSLTVYQKDLDAEQLQTLLIRREVESNDELFKPPVHVRDFTSLSGLLLIILFVTIIRVNPKLALDYFSFNRVLSIREAEDNQTHSRFAISSNVWFYIFCSLLVALYLMVVFTHLPEDYLLAKNADSLTFWPVAWEWIKLSFLVLLLLMCKGLIVFLLSNLFGMTGIAGVHFFNYIRFILILTSSLMVLLFIYYISRGTNPYVYLTFQYVLLFGLGSWILVLFFKLNNRIEHSMFHLFSYICATELIPLLITMKVLFE
jgi:hypothetical protein